MSLQTLGWSHWGRGEEEAGVKGEGVFSLAPFTPHPPARPPAPLLLSLLRPFGAGDA